MSKRCKWGLYGLSLFGLCSSLTLAAPVASLDEAVNLAITQNPEVKASWHSFEAAVDAVRASEGGLVSRGRRRQLRHDRPEREHTERAGSPRSGRPQ